MGGHQAWEAYRRGSAFGDAVIWLTRDHLVIGADNPVMYEQTMHRSDTIRQVTLGIELFHTTEHRVDDKKVRDLEYEAHVMLGENISVSPGSRLRLEGRVPIAPGLPPASPAVKQGIPRHEWEMVLRLEADEGGAYALRLPIAAAEPPSHRPQ